MSSQNPSPQLVNLCLLEGCRPVPVDAVVVGRCEECRFYDDCDTALDLFVHNNKGPHGCTDWKPRETVGKDERK